MNINLVRRTQKYVNKQLGWITGGALLLLAANSLPASANTTIVREVFNDSTAYGWQVGGTFNPCLTAAGVSQLDSIPNCGIPADTPGSGVLRITDPTKSKQAFVFYNYAIPSTQGLVITFDFYSYKGSSDPTVNAGADGVAFFLFDGNTSAPQSGADGGGLGYAQKIDVNQTLQGLTNGYIGVGLDEFGNYGNDYEGRGTGCPPSQQSLDRQPGLAPTSVSDRTKNSVTLRGPGGSDRLTGYCFLGNSGILPYQLDNPNATLRTDPGTKKRVRITLSPGTSSTITVEIDPNGGNNFQIVPGFNAVPAPPGRPNTFKFGFASSTGTLVNTHEIQNFQIDTINLPPLPDLKISKTHLDPISQGATGAYTLKVQNQGNGPTYGPIAIEDTLPNGFSFTSATGDKWNCSNVGQKVTCVYTGAAVEPNGNLPDLTINVNVTATPGNYINRALVRTQGDSNPSNDTIEDKTTVVGPVVASKSVIDINGLTNGKAKAGDVLQYTIAIANKTLISAIGVQFQDAIPSNTTYVPGTTKLNGEVVPDVNGTMPFVTLREVNSPGEPVGQINSSKTATVTFQVKINSPLPNNVIQIANQGTIAGRDFPPTPTDDTNTPVFGDPTVTPVTPITVVPSQPNLRIVKRITKVTRGGAVLGGIDFNSFVKDPADPNDTAPGWSQLSPIGVFKLGQDTPLKSADEVDYTVYFLSDGNGSANNVNLCDPIPSGTTFVPNSIQATIGTLPTSGKYFSPLAPLPAGSGCSNQNNPDGAVVVNLGNIPSIPGSNVGFIRFRVKIN